MSRKIVKSRRKQTYVLDDQSKADIKVMSSDTEAPPRPKSLKLEPEETISTLPSTSTSETTPFMNTSNTTQSSDVNPSLINVLPPTIQRLLSQWANQATPSPLTPNKIFNPTTISDEQIQIGITFDEIFNSMIRQSQGQSLLSPNFISTPVCQNSGSAPASQQSGGLVVPNHSILSSDSGHFKGSTSLTTSSSSGNVSTGQQQNVILSQQDISSLSAASVLQSHLLHHQTVSAPTINFIRSQPLSCSAAINTATNSAASGGATLQPFVCSNPTINGFPLLLCATNGTPININNFISNVSKAANNNNGMSGTAASLPSTITTTNNSNSVPTASSGSSFPIVSSSTVSTLPSSAPKVEVSSSHPPPSTHHHSLSNTHNLVSSQSRSSWAATTSSSTKPHRVSKEPFHSVKSYHSSTQPLVSGNVSDADRSSNSIHANSSSAVVEGDKLERKRARNRDAARKCREKKISLINMLEGELMGLHEHHQKLLHQLESEKKEVDSLKERVIEHKKHGCDITTQKHCSELAALTASSSSAL